MSKAMKAFGFCIMAGVAQLVRASVCGSEGRAFDSRHSPHNINLHKNNILFIEYSYITFLN